MKTFLYLLMYLLQKVAWAWVGALLTHTPVSVHAHFWGVDAAVRMSPCSPLGRAQLFIVGRGGSRSVAAFWALQPAWPPWDKLFGSDHRRQLASARWFVKVTWVFIVFLSKKFILSVKLLIFPTDWKVSWRLALLFTCIWWKLQTVSNLRNFNSLSHSDLEIEWASWARLQCSTACVMYVRYRLRPFSKHLH